MTRDKENYARIEAVVELLVSEGVITRTQATGIIDNRDFNDLHGRSEKARRGNGPPDFATGNGNGNGNQGTK